MEYNPHVKEITNEYMKKKSQTVIDFFDQFSDKEDVWGYFGRFYKKLLKQTTDTKYFINFFQEVRNYLAVVGKITHLGHINGRPGRRRRHSRKQYGFWY
jgi:hypothetical protein